jgi:hypothetical protein
VLQRHSKIKDFSQYAMNFHILKFTVATLNKYFITSQMGTFCFLPFFLSPFLLSIWFVLSKHTIFFLFFSFSPTFSSSQIPHHFTVSLNMLFCLSTQEYPKTYAQNLLKPPLQFLSFTQNTRPKSIDPIKEPKIS